MRMLKVVNLRNASKWSLFSHVLVVKLQQDCRLNMLVLCRVCSRAFMFLLSARACGLGINLPSITAVVVLDSDWSPKADIQALSRAHVLGPPPLSAGAPTAPIRILRLFMRNSVEEKILSLAERRGGVAAAFRPGSAGG